MPQTYSSFVNAGVVLNASAVIIPSATVLTTLNIVNTSGSTVAANSIPPSFGHPFKDGDIAVGTYPQLQMTSGGQQVPCTIYQPTYWPSGCMRFCCFLARIPVSIGANATVSINVMSGGGATGSGARSVGDLTAGGLNLQTKVTGQYNYSGTGNSILAHGISNTNQSNSSAGADILTYATGPVGNIYRIRASVEQSGTPDGYLETYWYCIPLEDASGNLYGIRYLPMMVQPWYDTSVTKQFRAFNTLQVLNGSTVLLDVISAAGTNPAYGVGQTFTATSPGSTTSLSCASNAALAELIYGQNTNASTAFYGANVLCFTTTTGTLPGNLSTGTPYWATIYTNVSPVGTVQFQLATQGSDGAQVTPSSAGSGTHTITPYPYISPFGAEVFCGTNGMYNYVQGNGSVAADAPLRIQYTTSYWCSTGMIPPYTASLTPTATPNPTMTKVWGVVYPFDFNQTDTGDRFDIGVMTSWNANHVFTQSAADEASVRCSSMVGLTESWWLRSATYRTIPVCNNNTYSGMPAAQTGFSWTGDGPSSSGITDPPSGGTGTVPFQAWGSGTESMVHKAEYNGYAYMFTGEVQNLDMLMNYLNMSIYSNYSVLGTAVVNSTTNFIGGVRNASINGTDYYAMVTGGQPRQASWSIRTNTLAQTLCGAHPENPNYKQYATDVNTASISGWAAFNAMNTTYWQANGLFALWDNQIIDPWEIYGYFLMSMAWRVAMTKDSNTLSLMNFILGWLTHSYNVWGNYPFASYNELVRTTQNDSAAIVTSDLQVGIFSETFANWTTSGFTLQDNYSGAYTPSNGDIVNFPPFVDNVDSGYQTPPGGFSIATPYYMVNLVGTGIGATFGLSATAGGTAIAPTNSGSDIAAGYNKSASSATPWPSTGFVAGTPGPGGSIPTLIAKAANFAVAVGGTVGSSAYADFETRFNAYGVSFVTDPRFDFGSSL